ncbi:MAG TPA: ATP-binding protein, partial [bacterium]|nr:ATP-binding protein [bacterium]
QVLGDPGMLEQVLVNLCLNARDAMAKGGKLTVATAVESPSTEFRQVRPWAKAEAYAVLTVSDTGHGITPHVQEHIFEPFFTTKDVGKGTGLGLSIVYGILQQHAGMVELTSRPGVGTSFYVYLPLAQPEQPATAPESSRDPAPGGAETILVVEDNPDLCAILTELLESRGYRVLAAQDGQEGLKTYTEHRAVIRLAILDSMMPKIGGLELFRRLREENPALPVIISSGYTATAPEAPLAALQDVPLLRKPYQIDALFRLVRQQLDRGNR